MAGGLGRRIPQTWTHVDKYPLHALIADPQHELVVPPAGTEKGLGLPWWWKSHDQGEEGSCFPPGTLVRLADGSHKMIEDIQVLDEVVTAEGRRGRVLQTMARFHDEGLVRLLLRGHRHLRCTPEHPILTRRGYVAVSELRIGDEVALTRAPRPALLDHLDTTTVLAKKERVIMSARTNVGVVATKPITILELIPLRRPFGELVGLFLAEGNAGGNKVVWTFGKHEVDTLVPHTVELIRETLRWEPALQTRPNGTTNVVVYGKAWARLFRRLFVFGPYDKSLGKLSAGGEQFLRGVLDGWIKGDGYRRRKVVQGVTVGRTLAMDMHALATDLGLRPTIRRTEVAGKRVRWDVEMADNRNPHSDQDEHAVWRRVVGLEEKPFAGFVHNLHVEGDESYVAEGIGVHNCVGFGCSAMMSVTNHAQRLAATGQDLTYRYAARWLYLEAQTIDEWDDTPPGEGTSVRAGCDILRARGHRRVQNRQTGPELLEHGIAANRWAQSIDEVRAAIFARLAVAIGVNWYSNFDDPILVNGEYWIGRGNIGLVRGGHCTALYRFSDRRQAVRMMNSWGPAYPPVWLPYDVLERLLHEFGEVAVITDR